MWKFPGQGSNPCHSSDHAGSLTQGAPRELLRFLSDKPRSIIRFYGAGLVSSSGPFLTKRAPRQCPHFSWEHWETSRLLTQLSAAKTSRGPGGSALKIQGRTAPTASREALGSEKEGRGSLLPTPPPIKPDTTRDKAICHTERGTVLKQFQI